MCVPKRQRKLQVNYDELCGFVKAIVVFVECCIVFDRERRLILMFTFWLTDGLFPGRCKG